MPNSRLLDILRLPDNRVCRPGSAVAPEERGEKEMATVVYYSCIFTGKAYDPTDYHHTYAQQSDPPNHMGTDRGTRW